MRKVNWRRRFNDVRGVLEEYAFPVSTAMVIRGLKSYGISWGYSATHQTLCSMANTRRIERHTVKGKDYWSIPAQNGALNNG